MLSSQVQFVGMGGNLKKAGYEYSGTLKVLENILNCEYLYNSVPVSYTHLDVYKRQVSELSKVDDEKSALYCRNEG